MKIGDLIRVVSVPDGLPEDDPATDRWMKTIFEPCVGHSFPIIDLTNGLIELEVGEVMGVESYLHSIWIEPDCVGLDVSREGAPQS